MPGGSRSAATWRVPTGAMPARCSRRRRLRGSCASAAASAACCAREHAAERTVELAHGRAPGRGHLRADRRRAQPVHDARRHAAADRGVERRRRHRFELHARVHGALRDLDGFSHVWLLVHLHRVDGWTPEVTPFLDPERPRGVLATRSPRHPNPIGLSLVELRRRRARVSLRIRGVDVLDGTPVLDVKPYVPLFDATRRGHRSHGVVRRRGRTGPDRALGRALRRLIAGLRGRREGAERRPAAVEAEQAGERGGVASPSRTTRRKSPRASRSSIASVIVASGASVGMSARAYARAGSDRSAVSGSSACATAPASGRPRRGSRSAHAGSRTGRRRSPMVASAGSVFGRDTMTSRTRRSAASSRSMCVWISSGSLIAADANP